LVELLVGIALLAVAAGIAVPSLAELMATYQLSSAADRIGFEISRARAQAMSQNRYVCVAVDGSVVERLRGDVGDIVGSCGSLGDDEVDETNNLPAAVTASGGPVMFSPGGVAVQNASITIENPAGTKTISTNVLGRVTIS
jgi:Tfp pilus assembly protein FimT